MATRKSLAQISKEAEQKTYFSSEYGFTKKTGFKVGSDVYVIPLDLENGLFTGRYHEVEPRKVGGQSKGLVGQFKTLVKCKGFDDEGNRIEGAKCCELAQLMQDKFPGSVKDDPSLTRKRVIGYSKEKAWLPVLILGTTETDPKKASVSPAKLSIKTYDFSYIDMSLKQFNKMVSSLTQKLKDEVGAIDYDMDEEEQKAITYKWLSRCVIKVHGITPSFGGNFAEKEYSFFPLNSEIIGKASGEHDAIKGFRKNETVMNAVTDFLTLFASEVDGLLQDVTDEKLEQYVLEGAERAENMEAFKQATVEEEELATDINTPEAQAEFEKEVASIDNALSDDEITFDTDDEESAFMAEDEFDEEFV